MNPTEPDDYITHIRHSRCDVEYRNRAWCDRDIHYQFAFGNIDHAAYSVQNGGRLVLCKECASAVMKALGGSDVTKPVSDVTKEQEPPFQRPKFRPGLPLEEAIVPGYTRIFSDE